MGLVFSVVIADGDIRGIHVGDDAVIFGKNTHAGVDCALVLNAGGNDRCLGRHQRNSLTLHVGAHQGTVCVIVLKERDHSCCNGDHHLGTYVDKIDFFAVYGDGIVPVAAGNALIDQAAVLIDRLGSLRYDVLVFLISRHVNDIVSQTAGSLLDSAVRCYQESVLIGTGIGSEITDQTDVRTFRRLDRAQTAIMAVVNVSHVETSSLTGKTAGAESGHTAFMRKFRKRVRLIHELAQRR